MQNLRGADRSQVSSWIHYMINGMSKFVAEPIRFGKSLSSCFCNHEVLNGRENKSIASTPTGLVCPHDGRGESDPRGDCGKP